MTGRRSLAKTALLKIGLVAGVLLIVAVVAYEGFPRDSNGAEAENDRSFDTTGSECDDLDLGRYSDLIAPIYLPWEQPTEVSSDRNQRHSQVTCISQTTIDEELCADAAEADCVDWYNEAPSIVNQFRVTITYHENASEAADSLETSTGFEQVPSSGIWDEIYESSSARSWGEQAELTSMFLADNLTIEMHSIIGEPVQTEAVIDEIFAMHSSLAEAIAQAADQ